MNHELQKTQREKTRQKLLHAALIVWQRHGELGLTVRRVGEVAGVSGQRVHKFFKNTKEMKLQAAHYAIETKHPGVIAQMQISRHPLAPAIQNRNLL